MAETRLIIGHAPHKAPGPHRMPPANFVPLRLCVEGQRLYIEVTSPIAIVGRHTDVDLRFAFPEVSRRHCSLVFENGQWRVYDLKSLNGMFVNNTLTVEATLYAGDRLRIGGVCLLVESATPIANAQHEKLRQIAEVLPSGSFD